jgi:hypothetical protein
MINRTKKLILTVSAACGSKIKVTKDIKYDAT